MSLPSLVAAVCVFWNIFVDIVVPARAALSLFELALQECLLGESLRKLCDVHDRHGRIACFVESADGSERYSFALDAEGRIMEG